MTKFYTVLFLILCSVWKQGWSQSIIGSTWANSNFDDCTSTIKFLEENVFQFYYCGINETATGFYSFSADTLKLDQYEEIQTPVTFGGSDKSHLRFKYSFVRDDTTLKMFKYSDVKYNYEETINDSKRNFKLIIN